MRDWLQQNKFTLTESGYVRRKINVNLSDNGCVVKYDNEIVWTGESGQDAIGVIEEYLNL